MLCEAMTTRAAGLLAVSFFAGGAALPAPLETQFLAEMRATMTRMHAAMSAQPAGDLDRDFVAMMIAHHQGAIDMAQIQLRYSRNEQLRRIAQEIIIEQQQEIGAMQLAVKASK
jgi:uncharacterized protein (DUF305 family)